jgi:hypothetical protein
MIFRINSIIYLNNINEIIFVIEKRRVYFNERNDFK